MCSAYAEYLSLDWLASTFPEKIAEILVMIVIRQSFWYRKDPFFFIKKKLQVYKN